MIWCFDSCRTIFFVRRWISKQSWLSSIYSSKDAHFYEATFSVSMKWMYFGTGMWFKLFKNLYKNVVTRNLENRVFYQFFTLIFTLNKSLLLWQWILKKWLLWTSVFLLIRHLEHRKRFLILLSLAFTLEIACRMSQYHKWSPLTLFFQIRDGIYTQFKVPRYISGKSES